MINEGGENSEEIFQDIDKALKHLKNTEKELEKREKILQLRLTRFEVERERENKRKRKRDEALNRKLDKIVEAKQALDTEIEEIKLETFVEEDDHHDDFDMKERIDELEKTLKEKEEESEEMEKFNQTLILKERKINDELQDVRQALIRGLREGSTRATIGVKLMGELDCKPFLAAMKAMFSGEEAEDRAAELCGLWETYLRDPSWHPYRVVADDLNSGTFKEIIDEEDERLKSLKTEYGEQVYNAVTVALIEISEYNPSGRYIVSELWNFKENRRATSKEGLLYIVKLLKAARKRRRTRRGVITHCQSVGSCS